MRILLACLHLHRLIGRVSLRQLVRGCVDIERSSRFCPADSRIRLRRSAPVAPLLVPTRVIPMVPLVRRACKRVQRTAAAVRRIRANPNSSPLYSLPASDAGRNRSRRDLRAAPVFGLRYRFCNFSTSPEIRGWAEAIIRWTSAHSTVSVRDSLPRIAQNLSQETASFIDACSTLRSGISGVCKIYHTLVRSRAPGRREQAL